MRIAISAQGDTLDAQTSPVFGRCPTFLLVDSDTMSYEALANPAMHESGGAGVQAAQLVLRSGAEAVLTGRLGPNAYAVLEAAGVPGYDVPEGPVEDAVRAFAAGALEPLRAGGGPGRSVGGAGADAGHRVGGTARFDSGDEVAASGSESLRAIVEENRRLLEEAMRRIDALERRDA